jgi:hypothetical protein
MREAGRVEATSGSGAVAPSDRGGGLVGGERGESDTSTDRGSVAVAEKPVIPVDRVI